MRIIQLTDTHLFGPNSENLWRVDTMQTFKDVIAKIKERQEKFDAIIVTGDIAHDGELETYKMFAEEISKMNADVYIIPGNHDNKENMDKLFPCENIKIDKSIFLDNWHIIMLDSLLPNRIEGKLSAEQFNYLQEQLTKYKEYHTIVALHHQPKLTDRLGDGYTLQNSEEFLSLLKTFPQVKIVLCGHVHLELTKSMGDIILLTTPSTNIQFNFSDSKLICDDQAPGYRWLELFEDGEFMSGVVRLPCLRGRI